MRRFTENGSERYELANFGFSVFQSLDLGTSVAGAVRTVSQLVQLNSSITAMNADTTDRVDDALSSASRGLKLAGIVYDVQASIFFSGAIIATDPNHAYYEVRHVLVADRVDAAGVPAGFSWNPWEVADFPVFGGGPLFPADEIDKPLRQLHGRSNLLGYAIRTFPGVANAITIRDHCSDDERFVHNRVSFRGRRLTDDQGIYLVLGNRLTSRDEGDSSAPAGSIIWNVTGQLYYKWVL